MYVLSVLQKSHFVLEWCSALLVTPASSVEVVTVVVPALEMLLVVVIVEPELVVLVIVRIVTPNEVTDLVVTV